MGRCMRLLGNWHVFADTRYRKCSEKQKNQSFAHICTSFYSRCDIGSKAEPVHLNGGTPKSSVDRPQLQLTCLLQCGVMSHPDSLHEESPLLPLPTVCENLPKEKVAVPRLMCYPGPRKRRLVQLLFADQG